MLAGAVPVLAATAALAAWLSAGTGSGSAAAASLTAPPAPTAVYDTGAVRVTWSAVTMPDGAAVDSYDVIRHVGANTLVVCTATAPSTTCTDDNPLVGTVTYGVVARKGLHWIGPESATKSFVSDQVKPVTTASVTPTPNGAGWNSAAVTVTLTATDTGGSGVKNITYSVDGAASVVANGASTSFAVSTDGTHTITYYARDYGTNVETAKSLTVKIDTAAPVAPTLTSISADTGASSSDQVTKTTAQTLSGTAEPGTTVIVKRGTTTMSTVTANASGIFTTTSLNLVAGVNSFTATSTDAAGNISAVSATFPVTLDTTAPAKPVLTGISNDTGVSTTDEITNVAAQVVSGTAEANSEVTVKQTVPSTATLGITNTDGSGAFGFAMDFTANQATTITATATDLAGNASTVSTGLVVKVDQIAPTTTVNSITPAPNAAGWNKATTAVVIGQTDTGTGGTDKLYTRLNAAAFTSVTTASRSVSVTTAVQGDNTVAYYAVDKAGNVGDSGSVVVKMDSGVPAKPVITGISNDTGTSNTDKITNAPAQTLSGTAEASSTVKVIRGGATIATGTASGTGSYAIPFTLVEGVNSLTVTATDAADNVSAASTALAVTLDTTMADPAFTSISNDTGSSSSDQITTVAAQTIAGTAKAGSTVVVKRGGTTIATLTASGTGTFSLATTLPIGTSNFTVTSSDVAGNSVTSTPWPVTLDTTAPAAPVLTGISDDTGASATDLVTKDANQTVFGTSEAGSVVTLKKGGSTVATVTADGGGTFGAGVTLLEGTNSFTAMATDVAGNVSTQSAALTVTLDTVAPAAPVLTSISDDTGVSSSDLITRTVNQTLSGKAEAGSTVTLAQNGSRGGTTTASGSGDFSFDLKLEDGSNTFFAVAVDLAGNVSPASADLVVSLDTTAPDGQITSLSEGQTYSNAPFRRTCAGRRDYSICGTAVDAVSAYTSGLSTLTLELRTGASCLDSSGTFTPAACGSPLHVTPEADWAQDTNAGGLGPAGYTATLTTTDVAGNVSVYVVNFTMQ